jgi:hypothetical protein
VGQSPWTIKGFDQQISEINKKLAAYPSTDHYEIDALALDTGTDYNHVPVYDHGMVMK